MVTCSCWGAPNPVVGIEPQIVIVKNLDSALKDSDSGRLAEPFVARFIGEEGEGFVRLDRPFVAGWDLFWSLGSSQYFCGLCFKIVVRDSISVQKEINSER